jgi:hypothetical protein
MSWLRGIGSELFGLFVDDGAFAVAIVIWLVSCGLVLPHLGLPSVVPPVLLFGGLVLILARSAVRRAGESS